MKCVTANVSISHMMFVYCIMMNAQPLGEKVPLVFEVLGWVTPTSKLCEKDAIIMAFSWLWSWQKLLSRALAIAPSSQQITLVSKYADYLPLHTMVALLPWLPLHRCVPKHHHVPKTYPIIATTIDWTAYSDVCEMMKAISIYRGLLLDIRAIGSNSEYWSAIVPRSMKTLAAVYRSCGVPLSLGSVTTAAAVALATTLCGSAELFCWHSRQFMFSSSSVTCRVCTLRSKIGHFLWAPP